MDLSFPKYVHIMNENVSKKQFLLNYVKGNLLDIGCGGGGFIKSALECYPDRVIAGLDCNEDMVEFARRELPDSHIYRGDALNLNDLQNIVKIEQIQTISFCSVLHEIFSYDCDGSGKFRKLRVLNALNNAFRALPMNGRILIRDGIRSENGDERRIIEFIDTEMRDLAMLYLDQFKGRFIDYDIMYPNKKRIQMPLDDAMELMYTITWGKEAFAREVQEQFGYFTPSEYRRQIKDLFGNDAQILFSQNFLQEGYESHILPKMRLLDPTGTSQMPLPDSTYIMVIEKWRS